MEGLPSNTSSNGSYPTIYGTILHPNGNIAELLLSEGFAKVNDWTLSMVSQPEKYRLCEKKAKEKRVRVWKDYTPAPSQLLSTSENEFDGIVTRILGSDMILVEHKGKERKISFSSL